MPNQPIFDLMVIAPAKDLFILEEPSKAYSICQKTNDNDLLFLASIIPLKSATQ